MYKHPEDGDSFNLDIPQDILRKMIKRNNIRLITE